MKIIFRVVSLTILTLAAITAVSAQDLGSANKLFGNAKPAPETTKKSNGKKTVVPKRHAPSNVTSSRRRTTAKVHNEKSVV